MNTIQFPRPRNFPYDDVLYADDGFAVVLGTYKNANHKSLGVRWTEAESELGYLSARGQGMWLVLPHKLALYMLEGLFKLTEALIYIRGQNRLVGKGT